MRNIDSFWKVKRDKFPKPFTMELDDIPEITIWLDHMVRDSGARWTNLQSGSDSLDGKWYSLDVDGGSGICGSLLVRISEADDPSPSYQAKYCGKLVVDWCNDLSFFVLELGKCLTESVRACVEATGKGTGRSMAMNFEELASAPFRDESWEGAKEANIILTGLRPLYEKGYLLWIRDLRVCCWGDERTADVWVSHDSKWHHLSLSFKNDTATIYFNGEKRWQGDCSRVEEEISRTLDSEFTNLE